MFKEYFIFSKNFLYRKNVFQMARPRIREGLGSVLVPDSQAFLPLPAMQLNPRPSQRKQRQAKAVLAKGVVVAVLRRDGLRNRRSLCP